MLFLFALDDPELAEVVNGFLPPDRACLKIETIGDHFVLRAEGLVHAMQDVLMWLIADEGERVDVITGDVGKAAHLVVDVLRQVLAARV